MAMVLAKIKIVVEFCFMVFSNFSGNIVCQRKGYARQLASAVCEMRLMANPGFLLFVPKVHKKQKDKLGRAKLRLAGDVQR